MKTRVSLVFALATLACGTASAQVDGLYYTGGNPPWPALQLNANKYVALANNDGLANQFFGANASGGVDAIANYGGGWVNGQVAPGTYKALTMNYTVGNWVFGANVAGGVDAIYYNGGWTTGQVNPHSFVSLANINAPYQFMGARTDGLLEFTYFNGASWLNYTVGTDSYKEVIFDPINANSVYALRVDGGIDRVTFNGSIWVTTPVDHSHSYVALTADRSVANLVYGATTGGLYGIGDYGGGFTPTVLSATSYKALEDITGGAYQLFGARADGTGLDAVYYAGGWTSYLANPNNYSVLLHDAANGNVYGAAPVLSTPPGVTGIGLLLDHNISLTVTGAVGTAWSLHATNDVALPRPWPVILSGTITTSPFTVDDLTATNYQQRFYQFSTP